MSSALRAELSLPAEPIAPALARAGVASLTASLPDEFAADVALLTTEIVSNAVRHAPTGSLVEIGLRADVGGGRIRVEVTDPGAGFSPHARARPGDLAASGWGLLLLDRLASRWGAAPDADGNTVWFELDIE
jgi:anti-sigma regulatory factor (Ser/Thr protein kinase)